MNNFSYSNHLKKQLEPGEQAIIKSFIPHGYYDGELPLVPLYVDDKSTSYLTKQASYIQEIAKSFPKEAGHSYIRVIAMGSGENYGSNANGDFFQEDELIKNHDTFEKIAKVYRHHNNKDPLKSYGDVMKSWYNPDMHRVELILKIANDKNRDVIYKLEAGEDVPVSMAAKVKYDICSICNNKAYSFPQHCDHLKTKMNKIASDGRRVFAFNPNPVFFDISFVNVPADRIAYTLEKVASKVRSRTINIPEVNLSRISKVAFAKVSLIKKLSEIEKRIEGMAKKIGKKKPLNNDEKAMHMMSKGLPEKSIKITKRIPSDQIAGFCNKHDVMLEPEEFMDSVGENDKDMVGRVKSLLPGGFGRLLEMPRELLSKALEHFKDLSSDVEGEEDLIDEKSFHPDKMHGRMIIITMKGKPSKRKLVEKINEKAADLVALRYADLYNIYKIAVCNEADPYSIVLQNYYQLPLP